MSRGPPPQNGGEHGYPSPISEGQSRAQGPAGLRDTSLSKAVSAAPSCGLFWWLKPYTDPRARQAGRQAHSSQGRPPSFLPPSPLVFLPLLLPQGLPRPDPRLGFRLCSLQGCFLGTWGGKTPRPWVGLGVLQEELIPGPLGVWLEHWLRALLPRFWANPSLSCLSFPSDCPRTLEVKGLKLEPQGHERRDPRSLCGAQSCRPVPPLLGPVLLPSPHSPGTGWMWALGCTGR